MKLLLDEMFSPSIARQLRDRGHDVVAVKERAELVGRSDRELVRGMAGERRAIVTTDADDFGEIAVRFAAAGDEHYGMLFTSDRILPRNKASIPLIVDALEGCSRSTRATMPTETALEPFRDSRL